MASGMLALLAAARAVSTGGACGGDGGGDVRVKERANERRSAAARREDARQALRGEVGDDRRGEARGGRRCFGVNTLSGIKHQNHSTKIGLERVGV